MLLRRILGDTVQPESALLRCRIKWTHISRTLSALVAYSHSFCWSMWFLSDDAPASIMYVCWWKQRQQIVSVLTSGLRIRDKIVKVLKYKIRITIMRLIILNRKSLWSCAYLISQFIPHWCIILYSNCQNYWCHFRHWWNSDVFHLGFLANMNSNWKKVKDGEGIIVYSWYEVSDL